MNNLIESIKKEINLDRFYTFTFKSFTPYLYSTTLIFEKNKDYPSFVLRTSTKKERILKHYLGLKKIYSIDNFKNSVPKPLFFKKSNNFWFSLETGLEGRLYKQKETNQIFQWLVKFHIYFKEDSKIQLYKLLKNKIETYCQLTNTKKLAFKDILDFSKKISVPKIKQNGDFWFNNLLINNNQIKVCDWENFGTYEPLVDILDMLEDTKDKKVYNKLLLDYSSIFQIDLKYFKILYINYLLYHFLDSSKKCGNSMFTNQNWVKKIDSLLKERFYLIE